MKTDAVGPEGEAKLPVDNVKESAVVLPREPLPPAAIRALQEAADRRRAQTPSRMAPELDGPAGPEPTRFGDWERKGIASDF